MSLDTVDLGDLAFSSYVYCQFTKYDTTYANFMSQVGGDLRLSDQSHGAALLNWLNDWGCRQFALSQHVATPLCQLMQTWASPVTEASQVQAVVMLIFGNSIGGCLAWIVRAQLIQSRSAFFPQNLFHCVY